MDLRTITWIFVIIIAFKSSSVRSQAAITTAFIGTRTPNYGSETAARTDDICNVTVNVQLAHPVRSSVLHLQVQFPYFVASQYIGQCGYQNKLRQRIKCVRVVRFVQSTVKVYVNGIQTTAFSKIYHSNNHTASFVWSNHGASLTNGSNIVFNFEMDTLSSSSLIGQHVFQFSTSYGANPSPFTNTKNATLRIIGPKIVVSSDKTENHTVAAGNTWDATISVALSPESTENATNISISMATYTQGLSINGTTGNATPIFIDELTTGYEHSFILNFNTNDRSVIGHLVKVHFQIRYMSLSHRANYSLDQTVSVGKLQDLQNLQIVMPSFSVLSPGSIVPVTVTFRMPKGHLSNLRFHLDCESSNLYPVPGALFYSNISLASGLFTNDHYNLIYTSSIYRGRMRRRRSTPVSRRLSRPPVTIRNPSSSSSNGEVTMKNAVGIDPSYRLTRPGQMKMDVAISYGSIYRVLRSVTTTVAQSSLQVTKSFTYSSTDSNGYPIMMVKINISHTSGSTGTAKGYLQDDILGLSPSGVSSSSWTVGSPEIQSSYLKIYFSLPAGQFYLVSYSASFIMNGRSNRFVEGKNNLNVMVYYNTNSTSPSAPSYQHFLIAGACVHRSNGIKYNDQPQYGYIVLLLICGIAVGFVLLLLLGVLYLKVVNKDVNPFEYDEVGNPNDRAAMMETQNRLLLDEGLTRGDFNTIKNLSNVSNSDSIVTTLVNKNHQQVHRDLDSLDVLNSIYIDQGLEDDYEKLSVDGLILLVQSTAHHGYIRQDVANKAIQKFQKNVQVLDKEIQAQHKKEANKVMKELSKKNKRELQHLLSKHKSERESLEEIVGGEDEESMKQILELQVKQQKAERDDLVHKLKLQQDEESEKLRKKFSLEKRSYMRDMERSLINDIAEKNPLNPAQLEWMMNEHRRIQDHLDQLYDSELARQRMVLEEKLERRRALAKKKELEEENQTEMLNTLASQQVNIIRRLRRQEDITPEQADEYLARIKEDMYRSKEALDREKEIQEKLLLEKLNSRKKRELDIKAANHQVEETQTVNQLKSTAVSTMTDPTAYIAAVMDLHARHRNDLEQMESEFDESDTQDLINQYQYSVGQTEANIRLSKDQLLQQLRQDGISDDDLNRITEKHNRELRQLQEAHQEERLVQEQNFKAKLLAKRKEMESSREQEKQEQDSLRRHENAMVQNLLMNQVSISDEERNRILQQHERNMVQVENSLTLSKLRQKRMLEEALAERKAKQMEKLQKKHTTETNNKLKFAGDSEDEDEKTHQDFVEMIKRQCEQKLELLRGEELDIDDEVEAVQNKLLEERANALKEQEERIATMLSTLQIEKAKELSRIEEQQKAISNLKMSLMDDLNERGVLSDNKCQQIIQRHQEEQDRLVQRLDNQRDEQAQILRDRLKKRMEQREKQMSSEQRREIEEKVEQLPAKQRAQAQIRKAILLHKQMMEIEQFRNRMTKECSQSLEEAKQQFDIKKEKFIQEQELSFIAGLVQLGKFKRGELLEVLKILLPLKSTAELEEIVAKIHSGNDEKLSSKKGVQDEETDPLAQSSIVDRTKLSFQGIGNLARFKLRSPKKKQTKGSLMTLDLGNNTDGLTPIGRPEPVGGDSPRVIRDAPVGRGSDLPPLEAKKKKKKKKKKRSQAIDEEDYDDDYVMNVAV